MHGIPGFAPMEKHNLYDFEKKSTASSSSLINTWESRPGWGMLAERMQVTVLFELSTLESTNWGLGKCNFYLERDKR